MLQLIGPAFAIALLGAIESLLTAVVADGMSGTRHNSNQELIGQGAANILSPLFGGFAATGAIARTATSIRNGATSPLAGVVHSVFLILVIVVLAPLASGIPLAALSAILFFVAWNMCDVRHFSRLLRTAPRSDKLLLLITFSSDGIRRPGGRRECRRCHGGAAFHATHGRIGERAGASIRHHVPAR